MSPGIRFIASMRARLRAARVRYGWRTPFVAVAALVQGARRAASTARALGWRVTTRGEKGEGVRIGARTHVTPGSHIDFGAGVTVGEDSTFEISVLPAARLSVGAKTWISHHCHICSYGNITIGESVLIGEFVSIRDSSHSFVVTAVPIREQADVIGTIRIDDDVWIGRGAVIIGSPEGVSIGRGAVIGANSVVTRSIPAMEVWAGAPCRLLRTRGLQGKSRP